MAESMDPHFLKDGITKILRPANSFVLFRAQFKDTLPKGTPLKDVSQLAGYAWNKLDTEEKRYWEGKANEARAEHRIKYPNYKYLPRRKGPKKEGADGAGDKPAKKKREKKAKGGKRAVLVDLNREEAAVECPGPSVAHAPDNGVSHTALSYSSAHIDGALWSMLSQNIHPSWFEALGPHMNQVARRMPVAQHYGEMYGQGAAFEYPVAGTSTSDASMSDLRRSAVWRSSLNARTMDGGEYRFAFAQSVHRDSSVHPSQDLNWQVAFAQCIDWTALLHGANRAYLNTFSTGAPPAYVPASSSRSLDVNDAVNSRHAYVHSQSAYGQTHAVNSNIIQPLTWNQQPQSPNNMESWIPPPQHSQVGTPWPSTQDWVPADQPGQILENPVDPGAYMDGSEPFQSDASVLNACESTGASTDSTTCTNETTEEGASVQPEDAHRERVTLSWEPNSEYPRIADEFLETWGLDDSLQPLEKSS